MKMKLQKDKLELELSLEEYRKQTEPRLAKLERSHAALEDYCEDQNLQIQDLQAKNKRLTEGKAELMRELKYSRREDAEFTGEEYVSDIEMEDRELTGGKILQMEGKWK